MATTEAVPSFQSPDSPSNLLFQATDALPCLASPIMTFAWIFFTSAPSTSVGLSILWLLLIGLPAIVSINVFMGLSRKTGMPEKSCWDWYQITKSQRAQLDFIRISSYAMAMSLLNCYACCRWTRALAATLKPLGSSDLDGWAIARWIVVSFGMLGGRAICFLIFLFIFVSFSYPWDSVCKQRKMAWEHVTRRIEEADGTLALKELEESKSTEPS